MYKPKTFLVCIQLSHLSFLMWSLTIKSAVLITTPHAIVFQNIQQASHLTEQQNSGTWQSTEGFDIHFMFSHWSYHTATTEHDWEIMWNILYYV